MFIPDIRFSLWLDFIERDFLQSRFSDLLQKGRVNGATSNPAIFQQAILTSEAYKSNIAACRSLGAKHLYETLAKEDIKAAAKALRAQYDAGDDGFVSIEIDPFLANNVHDSIAEGVRLFQEIGEPNVMIKVPATPQGCLVIKELVAQNINVNATLVFKDAQTKSILDAIGSVKTTTPTCVISVFVSRFDRLLNEKLPLDMQNRVGIMNAARQYAIVKESGLKNVKTLFASTGVKGGNLAPQYYIEELIGENCINTAPLATVEAAFNACETTATLPKSTDEIEQFFARLEHEGICFDDICDKLLADGLVQFEQAFSAILRALA